MVTPVIINSEQQIPQSSCTADKPYMLKVSDIAWKCGTEEEYQVKQASINASYNSIGAFLGVIAFLIIVVLIIISVVTL